MVGQILLRAKCNISEACGIQPFGGVLLDPSAQNTERLKIFSDVKLEKHLNGRGWPNLLLQTQQGGEGTCYAICLIVSSLYSILPISKTES